MSAAAANVTPDYAEIEETFELLDDWEERYRYVIDLGKKLPGLPDDAKNAATKVDGCVSQVWIVSETRMAPDGRKSFHFDGDSDAFIVRGLIAVLSALLNGKTPQEVAAADPLSEFAKLGFDSHLSPQRSNGLRAMIHRLRRSAEAADRGAA